MRRATIIGAVAILAAAAGFKPLIRDPLVPKNFGVIEPGAVYRAGQLSPGALEAVVQRHGIRTIVDLGAHEPDSAGARRNARAAQSLGLTRIVCDLEGDGTGNPNWYVVALRVMRDPAYRPVLVHCGGGSERTGGVAILYEALRAGHALDARAIEAGLEQARRYGHEESRNGRLRQMLEQWGPAILEAVRRGGQIPGVETVPDPVGGA